MVLSKPNHVDGNHPLFFFSFFFFFSRKLCDLISDGDKWQHPYKVYKRHGKDASKAQT
jgi:hypothetical protein